MNKRTFLFVASILFLTSAVFAQVGSIQGTVMLPPPLGPAMGATVTIVRMQQDSLTTTTDSLGHFRFDSVTAGPWLARATLDGYVPAAHMVFVPAGHVGHVTLLLHAPPTGFGVVRGTVVLPQFGGPAAGATVWLFRAHGDSMVATADDSGHFQFDSAVVGVHDLYASLVGYRNAHRDVHVIDGHTVNALLVLRPVLEPVYGSIEGTVIFAADSLPAAGVTVTLFRMHHDSVVVTTDAEGHFAFDSVRVGMHMIRAALEGYIPASRGVLVRHGETTTVTLALNPLPTAVVDGFVTLADQTPVAHAFVWMFVPGQPHHHRAFRTVTDSTGHFTFEHVPAGDYTINAAKRLVGFATAQITVVDGQTTSITLVLGDSTGDGGRAPGTASGVDDPNALPVKQFIANNYPNPFNPTTTISYSIPAASFVRLSVYDVLGRKVADLVNGHREAGSYNVSFNGETLPSGIYIYRLTAGDFSHTGRMTLLK